MADAFAARVTVRGYELDMNGHVNQAVYMQYGEHARWEFLKAAGISGTALAESGMGTVVLELTIRFHNELRDGDTVDVTCAYTSRSEKTFTVAHTLHRTDGVLAAEITGTGGLLNLTTRRLLPNPIAHLESLSTNPTLFHPTPA
ncbi:MAG TPA: acyl-CoA thioesterase [Streptosporangiaceae bacterium]|jgi:acyl-CoA thioester hydrolase